MADVARGDAECEALQSTLNTQAEEPAHARETLAPLTTERAHLAAQVGAQQLLLAEYRARLGLDAPPEASRQISHEKDGLLKSCDLLVVDFSCDFRRNRQILHEKYDYP